MFSFINGHKRETCLIAVTIISLAFIYSVALDITPFLRGPIDNIIASRWPYYFVNTFDKIWIFIPIVFLYILLFIFISKQKTIDKNKETFYLAGIIILTFMFQLALVYFSRFGITILFRRLVDPGINGYFTTAIQINNVQDFLNNFPSIVNARHLSQHASGHTPGAIFFIKSLIDLIGILPLKDLLNVVNQLQVGWAKGLWDNLTFNQRIASLTTPFILHFIAASAVLPFYYLAKTFLKDSKSAFFTTLLFSIIPSLSFFALIFDPFYGILTIVLLLLIYKGVEGRKDMYIFFSGIIAGIGLFFTAATLTILIGLFVFSVLSIIAGFKHIFRQFIYFSVGFISVIIGFYLIGFDLPRSVVAVIHNQASREYLAWVVFNPYDFFVFMGLPLSTLFLIFTGIAMRERIKLKLTITRTLYSFWIVFLLLIFSGASRGEVGRIWFLFMVIPIILAGNFTKLLNFKREHYIIIFLLVLLQTIIMEEYWVPIW
jgi:hypothetical protein